MNTNIDSVTENKIMDSLEREFNRQEEKRIMRICKRHIQTVYEIDDYFHLTSKFPIEKSLKDMYKYSIIRLQYLINLVSSKHITKKMAREYYEKYEKDEIERIIVFGIKNNASGLREYETQCNELVKCILGNF